MIERLSRFVWPVDFFISRGSDAAYQQALALLDQLVNTQAALLSYADTFRFVGLLFLCSLPLLLFLGAGGPRKQVSIGH